MGPIELDQTSILEKRKLQAQVIKPIYEEMILSFGKEKAQEIIKKAIIKNALEEGAELRRKVDQKNKDNVTVIDRFIEIFEPWKTGGALEINEIKKNDEVYHFDVTRCKYSEMYEQMGLKEIGGLLSCNRDSNFSKGFDKNLKLEREQTIMEGSSCCTFRYKLDKS